MMMGGGGGGGMLGSSDSDTWDVPGGALDGDGVTPVEAAAAAAAGVR